MSDADKGLTKKPPATRTGIMLMLAPALETAVKSSNLDLTDMATLRRYFRALVHLALKKPLDAGVHPDLLMAQVLEAFAREMDERDPEITQSN